MLEELPGRGTAASGTCEEAGVVLKVSSQINACQSRLLSLWPSPSARRQRRGSVSADVLMQLLQTSCVQGGRRGSGAGSAAKGGGIAFGRRQDMPAPALLPSDRTPDSTAKAPQGRAPRVPALPLGSAQRTGVPSLATPCLCLLTCRETVGWPCAQTPGQCIAMNRCGMLHAD